MAKNNDKQEKSNELAKVEFATLSEKLSDSSEGFFLIKVEDFYKASSTVDGILNMVRKFDPDQVEAELSRKNIDIKDVCEANYSEMLKEVAARRDYLIEQEGNVRAFVSWYNKCIELLSAYVQLLSKTKPVELRKHEALIKVQSYHIKREFYTDLLTRVEAKREAYTKKYDSVSRLVSYWDMMTKVNFARPSAPKPGDRPH